MDKVIREDYSGNLRVECQDNIKTDPAEIGHKFMNRIRLARGMVQWMYFVKMAMNHFRIQPRVYRLHGEEFAS